MKPVYLSAVDLGTSFIKVGIYDLEGNCLELTREPVRSESPAPGIYIQKSEEIYDSVLACINRASHAFGERASDIAAIAFTGQMAGFMGVDKDWNDLTTWSCSLDTRYVPYAARQMEQHRDAFLALSGTNAPLMAPKCEWFVTEFPEAAKHIAKYMVISSYIIGRLGNLSIEDAVIDTSYITWTGLADIRNNCWSEELCRIAGITTDKLPRIVRANEICGTLSAESARAAGLSAGIPLVTGTGDKMAGCIGSGVMNTGDMIFEASSYGAISCVADEFIPDMEMRNYDGIPGFLDARYYLHKYIPGSGVTLRWFLDTFTDKQGNWQEQFAMLEAECRDTPCGCDGLMAVGLLGGSAIPFNGDLRGLWIGHTWSHKKAHFYRALLESYAYEIAMTIDGISGMYPQLDTGTRVKLIGGGSRSAIWPQILADVTGRKFDVVSREDVALWGTARLAGNAIRVIPELIDLSGAENKPEKSFYPDHYRTKTYRRYKEVYAQLLAGSEMYNRLLQQINR